MSKQGSRCGIKAITVQRTATMNGLPAPPPAVQVDYWLAKIHNEYKFHKNSALRFGYFLNLQWM